LGFAFVLRQPVCCLSVSVMIGLTCFPVDEEDCWHAGRQVSRWSQPSSPAPAPSQTARGDRQSALRPCAITRTRCGAHEESLSQRSDRGVYGQRPVKL
ncbi:hypothetical protein GE09DRAFT_1140908, partial [Coniochaeta sp. 2T2.1]